MLPVMNSMNMETNGEFREISPVSDVRESLQLLGIAEGRVAVEVNRKIIRRAELYASASSPFQGISR